MGHNRARDAKKLKRRRARREQERLADRNWAALWATLELGKQSGLQFARLRMQEQVLAPMLKEWARAAAIPQPIADPQWEWDTAEQG